MEKRFVVGRNPNPVFNRSNHRSMATRAALNLKKQKVAKTRNNLQRLEPLANNRAYRLVPRFKGFGEQGLHG